MYCGGSSTTSCPSPRNSRAQWCEAPQASSPIRVGASLAKNFATAPRRSCARNTASSVSSTPTLIRFRVAERWVPAFAGTTVCSVRGICRLARQQGIVVAGHAVRTQSRREFEREAGMPLRSKVVITCAVTGSIHTPTMSPYLPLTPDEVAKDAIAAAEAGAAILHLHARDPKDGRPTPDPDVFMQFLPRIKQATNA